MFGLIKKAFSFKNWGITLGIAVVLISIFWVFSLVKDDKPGDDITWVG